MCRTVLWHFSILLTITCVGLQQARALIDVGAGSVVQRNTRFLGLSAENALRARDSLALIARRAAEAPPPELPAVRSGTAGTPHSAFTSLALEYFPPDPSAEPSAAMWKPQPGRVNDALLERSPDHSALQRVLWDSLALGLAYRVFRDEDYGVRGRALLMAAFGPCALEPHMQRARMIPTASLAHLQENPLGFHEMADVAAATAAATLLDLPAPDAEAFDLWMKQYAAWLGDRVASNSIGGSLVHDLAAHQQLATVATYLGLADALNTHCLAISEVVPQLVQNDGSLVQTNQGSNAAERHMDTLHSLVRAAVACEGSTVDVWQLSDQDVAVGPFLRRAGNHAAAALNHGRLALLPFERGGVAGRHAAEALAILFHESGQPGLNGLLQRVLASNPELLESGVPLVASLLHVDAAAHPAWAGFRSKPFSCDELQAQGLQCDTDYSGFTWLSLVGGLVIAGCAVALLLFVIVSVFACRLLQRRRQALSKQLQESDGVHSGSDTDGEEKVVDKVVMREVRVQPYEPDGYDPNNKSLSIMDLTTGEQVLKTREMREKMTRHVSSPMSSPGLNGSPCARDSTPLPAGDASSTLNDVATFFGMLPKAPRAGKGEGAAAAGMHRSTSGSMMDGITATHSHMSGAGSVVSASQMSPKHSTGMPALAAAPASVLSLTGPSASLMGAIPPVAFAAGYVQASQLSCSQMSPSQMSRSPSQSLMSPAGSLMGAASVAAPVAAEDARPSSHLPQGLPSTPDLASPQKRRQSSRRASMAALMSGSPRLTKSRSCGRHSPSPPAPAVRTAPGTPRNLQSRSSVVHSSSNEGSPHKAAVDRVNARIRGGRRGHATHRTGIPLADPGARLMHSMHTPSLSGDVSDNACRGSHHREGLLEDLAPSYTSASLPGVLALDEPEDEDLTRPQGGYCCEEVEEEVGGADGADRALAELGSALAQLQKAVNTPPGKSKRQKSMDRVQAGGEWPQARLPASPREPPQPHIAPAVAAAIQAELKANAHNTPEFGVEPQVAGGQRRAHSGEQLCGSAPAAGPARLERVCFEESCFDDGTAGSGADGEALESQLVPGPTLMPGGGFGSVSLADSIRPPKEAQSGSPGESFDLLNQQARADHPGHLQRLQQHPGQEAGLAGFQWNYAAAASESLMPDSQASTTALSHGLPAIHPLPQDLPATAFLQRGLRPASAASSGMLPRGGASRQASGTAALDEGDDTAQVSITRTLGPLVQSIDSDMGPMPISSNLFEVRDSGLVSMVSAALGHARLQPHSENPTPNGSITGSLNTSRQTSPRNSPMYSPGMMTTTLSLPDAQAAPYSPHTVGAHQMFNSINKADTASVQMHENPLMDSVH